MKRKYILLLLIICLPSVVFAKNRVIDGNEFDVYKRSKEDILDKWNTLGVIDNSVTKYVSNPSYTNPYKAGVLTSDYLKEVNDNLNYYRYLVGVPLTTKIPVNNNDLQTAEVIQTLNVNAGNNLTHELYNDFAKPSDMDQTFYNTGAYANHNIVSYVRNRQMQPNFDFFNESYFTTTAGHRTTLLTPELSYMDYGIGDMVVYGKGNNDREQYNKMTNSYAAYPSPGYFPKQDLANDTDWDVYLNINDFNYLNSEEEKNVVVNIISRIQGIVDTRRVSDNNLVFEKSNGSYYRLLIQKPTLVTTYYESDYLVQITNLKDKDNNYVDLVYEINFFDKYEGIDANIIDFNFDLSLSALHIDGDYNQQFINKVLDDIGIQVYLDSGAIFYDKIKRYNIKSVDTNKYNAFADITLPSYAKDTYNLIRDYSYIDIVNYPSDYHFVYNDLEYKTKIGNDIKLSLKSFTPNTYPNSSGEASANFFWFKENGDKLEIIEPSSKYITDGGYLKINNVSKSDEGKYYAGIMLFVPYEYYGNTIYATDYYFSKPLTLTVDGMKGDMNLNNIIDLPDVIKLLKIYLGVDDISDNDMAIGDMNSDGEINLTDVISLLRIYLGVE